MKMKEKSADEMLDNGAETWLTGIVEVELPMDEKLRNIEETEAAKKKILSERMRCLPACGYVFICLWPCLHLPVAMSLSACIWLQRRQIVSRSLLN